MRYPFYSGLVLLLSLFFLSSCQPSHKEKVQNAVKKHLKAKAGKDRNYEAKNFGTIDSHYLDVQATNQFKKLTDTMRLIGQIDGLDMRIDATLDEAKRDSLKQELARKRENLKKHRKMLKDYLANYDPVLNGFLQPHTYKLNDSSYERVFLVDTTYKVDSSYAK